jgi:hypothetical protein
MHALAEQHAPNKPNFKTQDMRLKPFMEGAYIEIARAPAPKKQTQSKPIRRAVRVRSRGWLWGPAVVHLWAMEHDCRQERTIIWEDPA